MPRIRTRADRVGPDRDRAVDGGRRWPPPAHPGGLRLSRLARLGSAGRRRTARRRLLAWIVLAAVAVTVQRSIAGADATRASWHGDHDALVVVHALDAGRSVGPGDVRRERLPAAVVPADGLRALPDRAIAAIRLTPGTVVGTSMLVDDRRSTTARSLPPGRVAVVVRTGDLPRLAEPGDEVDVRSPTWDEPVTTAARVIRVDGDAVTLAVIDHDAGPTATAGMAGPVALVLRR